MSRGVGIWLMLAGLLKLADLGSFSEALQNYQYLPTWSIQSLTTFVPSLELVVGFRLFFADTTASRLWATLLFGSFSLLLARAWSLHLPLTCGCFGSATVWLHRQPLGLELHFLLVLAVTIGLVRKLQSPARHGDRPTQKPQIF